MANFRTIPIDELRQLMWCDFETGQIFYLRRNPTTKWDKAFNSQFAGKEAGSIQNDGYKAATIRNLKIKNHRIVWALFYGEWPTEQVDHLNHIRTDNRISNLRVVSHETNSMNTKLPKDNKTGVIGVHWRKDGRKYEAYITANGKMKKLGCFEHLEHAVLARKMAEKELGFHANHGHSFT